MRAVAYIRVSSLSQVEGHSLDAQERLFKNLCKNRGWEPVRTYREEGKSAHVEAISRRPVFRQLLEDAKRGDFDAVVVHTLDRWSRNQKVTLETLGYLAKSNVSLVSITENIDFTATGASDHITRFIFEDAYSVAQSVENSGAISNTTATMVVNDGTAISDVTNVAAVPAAAWLFASGLIGVVGVGRRSPGAAALSA